jgi:kanamycin kinase
VADFPEPPLDLDGNKSLGDAAVPTEVTNRADELGVEPELVWRNELGGLTFRLGDRYLKWSPRSAGVDLDRERVRLDWLSSRHPAPAVLDHGEDDAAQWLITAALPGEHAVGDRWRQRTPEAITAIALGLRALHAVPAAEVPTAWSDQAWFNTVVDSLGHPPANDELVLVHGDACAPNTLISAEGAWVGHVDLGDLGVGDRWADLAIASLSLDWNFGQGWQPALFAAYGVAPDLERIEYYRALWHLAS